MRPRVVILGAGRPIDGATPSVLRQTDRRRRVLDWILHAFKPLEAEIVYVGGYRAAEISANYRDLALVENSDWETTGALGSLFKAPLSTDRDHYICYSDIVFRDSLVSSLSAVDASCIGVAVDRKYLFHSGDDSHRGDFAKEQLALDQSKAEFVGLIRVPQSIMPKVVALAPLVYAEPLRRKHLTALIEELVRSGSVIAPVDAEGDWSDLDSDMALSRFVLGTKAETLDRLRDRLKKAEIAPQIRFPVKRWRTDAKAVIADIHRVLPSETLAVRSSALVEDGFSSAHAGRFRSCLNVGRDEEQLSAAIDSVVASYEGFDKDQVFVQPMLTDVAMSGVAFTRGIGNGAPYFSINFAMGPDTDSITSGSSQSGRTLVLHRTDGKLPEGCPPVIGDLVAAIHEIEDAVDYDRLDIEFAIGRDSVIHILQVRPLAASHEWNDDVKLRAVISDAASSFRVLSASSNGVSENLAVFANMPDWNPAEIIGTRPRGLAASLYSYLVMDDTWARQRAEFGYRDLRGTPLMRMFASQPYVDVRASFHSFTPASVPDGIASRLVDSYLRKLRQYPELHDKVEFDIVPTCLAFDFSSWDERLRDEAGLSARDVNVLRSGLAEITQGAFSRYHSDFAAGETLTRRFEETKKTPSSLGRARELLADCKLYGALPFAHLAREAFIAMTLIRSAVARGALTADRVETFLSSIRTVSQNLSLDAAQVRGGHLSFGAFADRYGHLRPGTYDILSPCYLDAADFYLAPLIEQAHPAPAAAFEWSTAEARAIELLLRETGYDLTMPEFDRFLRVAIEGRESHKFLFTRNLSLALNDIAGFGTKVGLSREQLSELHYSDIFDHADETGFGLAALSERRSAERIFEQAVELPPLLRGEQDFWGFFYPLTEPNYITSGRVTGSSLDLEKGGVSVTDLAGKIVLIPQADPGYDWLFGHDIAGLITQFGGANSHMAIRAAEHLLPSAIGVGYDRYEMLKRARLIDLNCATRQLAVLS